MVWTRKYVCKKKFKGLPKKDDYEIVTVELPPLQDMEFLVKTEWISVDPYLKLFNAQRPVPYDQFGFQVGIVQESKDPKFPVGARVVSHKGWSEYTIMKEKVDDPTQDGVFLLPDLHGLSTSLGVGAIGLPGATAYCGLIELCKPKAGETVVVSGAAGAVGSLAGQIAKIKGCKVIGFAGSDKKVKWLETELGFDKAFNYKTVNVMQALKEAAPEGVDCFVDTVGGEMFTSVVPMMNRAGRIGACGSTSTYNDDPLNLPKVPDVQPIIVTREIKVEGMRTEHWIAHWPQWFAEIGKWIHMGQLKTPEHVTEGFDNLVEALVGMLVGENFGKAVVKV